MVVYFALQNQIDDEGNTAWYPVGRILVWLSMLGIGAFVVAHVISCRATEACGTIEAYLKSVIAGFAQADQAAMDACSRPLQRFSPVLRRSWILMNIINCVMARFLTATDKNTAQTGLSGLEIPSWPAGVVVLGGVLAFLAENRLFGFNIMLIASIPFSLLDWQFCIVSPPLGLDARSLAGVYLLLIIALWPAAFVALLGVLELWLRLRDRAKARRTIRKQIMD